MKNLDNLFLEEIMAGLELEAAIYDPWKKIYRLLLKEHEIVYERLTLLILCRFSLDGCNDIL